MVRCSTAQGTPAWGCPRLRGDGPWHRLPHAGCCRVSPPTRGWSHHHAVAQATTDGVPAYAGMVPCTAPRAKACRRCPRLRGDGPGPQLRPHATRTVSPPTRGWSRLNVPLQPTLYGVPAYAGMVPSMMRYRPVAGRCPRLRGDGPYTLDGDGYLTVVSPPTRGWSRTVHCATRVDNGVPAYAGMVPSTCRDFTTDRRCPRLRGDGPMGYLRAGISYQVSPPTRGWSRHGRPAPHPRTGVPAYAGMVPKYGISKRAYPRCPRLRGDGPLHRKRNDALPGVSPPTRGWSRQGE